MSLPYAHTHPDPTAPWEPLFTAFGTGSEDCQREACLQCQAQEPYHGHLNKVAWWTAKFTSEMLAPGSTDAKSAKEWGYLAGLWHDLGKFAAEWQTYLAGKADPHIADSSGKVDHSTAGAKHSHINIPHFGSLLAYIVAGHHAGLADGIDSTDSNLTKRLAKVVPAYLDHTPSEIISFAATLPAIPSALCCPISLGFFLRLLFSALVDADFLATEAFVSPNRQHDRPQKQPTIQSLEAALATHLEELAARAKPTSVNRIRAHVLQQSLAAAKESPGLFSLTVPTGGGKTLSSLAFALKHARIHNLRRVIYVIPFTSIIEQNAAVFRKIFATLGPDIVLEHHSNLDPDSRHETTTNRLASENWDARIIVTTNVQFFESLHSNRTSKCRKLHRIARSVIILDEAQALPVEFLAPCLRALKELHTHYGATIVLCTATQPAIHRSEDFKIGLDSPREIISSPTELYISLRRVCTHRLSGRTDNLTLAALIKEHPQVLTIVNTRRHARELFDLLPDDGSRFHLSALMCPNHRRIVLYLVKRRLRQNLPVRLVSTQLIEAGVDIDFPFVFRSLAGLDSIAQAAGRCDREGHVTAKTGKPGGQLYLFETSEYSTPSFIQSATNSTIQVLAHGPPDPLSLDSIHNYFQRHYWDNRQSTDQKHILENVPKHLCSADDLFNFQFKTTARDFALIDDYTDPVLIPFGKRGRSLYAKLRETFDPAELRRLARKLQRYTVNIPKQQQAELIYAGIVLPLHGGYFHFLNSDPHYHLQFGLHPKADLTLTPENSII